MAATTRAKCSNNRQKVADCWQEVNGVKTVDLWLQEKGGRRTLEEAIGTIGTIRTGGLKKDHEIGTLALSAKE